MGRKSRNAFAALQGAEAQRILALQAIPPAPGEARRRLPTIRTDVATYNQPEFMAWFYASDAAKADGSWAAGLDAAGQGGPSLAASQAAQATAATWGSMTTPPYVSVAPAAADPVTGPDYWGAADMGEGGRTVTRYGDEGPAAELLTEEADAAEAGQSSGGLVLVLVLAGAAYLAWRVFRG